MRLLYNTLLLPARVAATVWGVWMLRGARGEEWRERLARRLPRAARGGVWIHGASVGEARLAGAIAKALRRERPGLPLYLSAYTTTGRGELPTAPEVDAAFYAPLDFSGLPGRVLDALRPRALVLVETELWPNLLHECRRASVRTAVVNGRLSERRMSTYRRLSGLYGPIVRDLDVIGAQSPADAERFVALGVPERALHVTGNLKYDLTTTPTDAVALRAAFGLPPAVPVFVAGSTAEGEDRMVLQAFARAREVRDDLLLVLAPRHPERCRDVERLVLDQGLRLRRASAGAEAKDPFDVLLVDSIGPLRQLYGVAAAAFVGGSLVAVGGHNVLEPVAAGAPVLFGPHTESVAEPAADLVSCGGGLRVRDAQELGREVASLLAQPSRARQVVERGQALVAANRGALSRSVRLLLDLIPPGRAAGADAP